MTETRTPTIEELLQQGADLLAGDPAAACHRAEQVLVRRPSHPLASNLMGLGLLAQSRHAEALALFAPLARRNPDVVSLHVNAGIAALGLGALEQALEHLRRAIDLDPAHARVFGYLALVHLQLGEVSFARAALQEAGLDALASQLGGDDLQAVRRELELGVQALPTQDEIAPHEGFAEHRPGAQDITAHGADLSPGPSGEKHRSGAERSAQDVTEHAVVQQIRRADQPLPGYAPAVVEITRKTLIPRGNLPTPAVEARSLHATREVELQGPLLLLQLDTQTTQDGVLLRRDLQLLQQGSVQFTPAERRRKGSSAGPFLVQNQVQLMRAEGTGRLALHPGSSPRFHLFRLEQAGLYVKQHSIVAFSDRLYWENGRIPRGGDDSPPIVTLRGTGFVALLGRGQLWRVESSEIPLWVSIEHLLGWSPDVVPEIPRDAATDPTEHVGFRGAGVVWLDVPDPQA